MYGAMTGAGISPRMVEPMESADTRMQRVISTYRYLNQTLTPAMLKGFSSAHIPAVEIFCSAPHFDYRTEQTVREMADCLSSNGLELHSLHAPTERNLAHGRDNGAPLAISEPERARRIEAIDEMKRALEVAERIPFRFFVVHMGGERQPADERRLDAAFSALEQMVLFAKQRGVVIALENTPGELGAPATLQQFIAQTHLQDLRLCFDTGHANIGDGIAASFEVMRDLVVTTHIHDNHGDKDEHLVPFDGVIDWPAAFSLLATARQPLPVVLELKEQTAAAPSVEQAVAAFDRLEREFEKPRTQAARTS
jgi:sugar phosphate isomerase/epimerase